MFNAPQNNIKMVGNYQYNPKFCFGEGSYGKVFQGVDNNNNQCAIKQIILRNIENDKYLQQQMQSEIEILKKLNHKNVVRLIDILYTQNSLYIVTELCEDGDIRKLIRRQGINEYEGLNIISQIIDGYQELHKHKVIHRDLKPANILKHQNCYKLADFGFAKFGDNLNNQMFKSCVGSPLYMAPQILGQKQYSNKCDIWSMGVIFYELVVGMPPWTADNEKNLYSNIIKQPLYVKNDIKVSSLTETVFKKLLVLEERNRATWEELFEFNDKHLRQYNTTTQQSIPYQPTTNVNQGQNVQQLNNNTYLSNPQKQKNDIVQFIKFVDNIRLDLNFKVYVISEIELNKDLLINVFEQESNELGTNFIKFILLNLQIIKNASDLFKIEINEKFQNMSQEMKNCYNSFLKDNKDHDDFIRETKEIYIDQPNIQSDKEIMYLIRNEINDKSRVQLINTMKLLGRKLINVLGIHMKQIIQQFNIQQSEIYRTLIICLDYLTDYMRLFIKNNKIQLNYDNIHLDKQEIINNSNRYLANLFKKVEETDKQLK